MDVACWTISSSAFSDSDGWTIRTSDGEVSAHFEHTICVGKESAEILTIPDLNS